MYSTNIFFLCLIKDKKKRKNENLLYIISCSFEIVALFLGRKQHDGEKEGPKAKRKQPKKRKDHDAERTEEPTADGKRKRKGKATASSSKKKGTKHGKAKRRELTSRSSSNVSSELSQSSEESSGESSGADSSGEESDNSSSSETGRRLRRSKKKSGPDNGSAHWQLVNEMWSFEDRPKLLQDKKRVESMTIAEISQFKAHFEKEEEKKGVGAAVFGKDKKLQPVKVRKCTDDGDNKLSAARFDLRMPVSAPKKYWSMVPKKREVFRHLTLSHLGLEGQVSETTIVRMHDRRVPITLDMLYKANAFRDIKPEQEQWLELTEVCHLQEAILNYVVVLWAIWPFDYAGFVIQRVLVESNWGRAAGEAERQRVALVRWFFDEVARENSGRAVRGQPPLVYQETKAKWIRVLESMFPNMTLLGSSSASSGSQGKGQAQQQIDGGGCGGGNNTRGRGRGGRGGARSGRGGATQLPGGYVRQGAVASGLPVCYRYNLLVGCQRQVVSPTVCEEAGKQYAHACNSLDKNTNKFCLQLHPRHKNH